MTVSSDDKRDENAMTTISLCQVSTPPGICKANNEGHFIADGHSFGRVLADVSPELNGAYTVRCELTQKQLAEAVHEKLLAIHSIR